MEEAQAAAAAAARTTETLTQVGDLPEVCLAQAIARTSPRDACRCAAVSQAFRAAADSDQVWHTFLPQQLEELEHQWGGGGGDSSVVSSPPPPPPPQALRGRGSKSKSKKDAYLGLCDAASAVAVDGGGCRLWLERATGARCYALSARRLSLPWDDGEFSWRFTHHPRSRFAEVAELVDCTGLDIYGSLPAAALTPATTYAAFLVYGTAPEGSHRGLSYPDQETAVAVGGRVVARHAVCLRPDVAEARKFRDRGGDDEQTRRPRLREDGWWEMEMGRLHTPPPPAVIRVVSTPPPPLVVVVEDGDSDVVQASFEVLGWYPKRGLVVEGIEFRPLE